MPRHSFGWSGDLLRPAPLTALVLLVTNDHILKGAGLVPSAITGKLSDVAGLFLAAILGVCLVRGAALLALGWAPRRDGRAATATLLGIGASFAGLKLWPALNAALERVWGTNSLDATDLYALPVLALAYLWLRERHEETSGPTPDHAPPRFASATALVAALFACAATPAQPPPPPPPVAAWVVSDATHVVRCGDVRAWVSKSGKTGFGLTVRVVPRDEGCPVRIAAARVRVGRGDAISGRAMPVLARPEGPQRGRPTRSTAEAADLEEATYHYVAFAFDNNARWNRGERNATVEIELAYDGKTVLWSMPAEQRMVSFPARHR